MKKIAVILSVLICVFTMVSCDLYLYESAALKVVNEYGSPITRVEVTGGILDADDLAIMPGTAQTFTNIRDDRLINGSVDIPIFIYANRVGSNGRFVMTNVHFMAGQTTTVILGADGKLR